MANYQLEQTGAEVQALLNAVASPDTTPAAGSSNLITSGAVQAAVAGVSAEVTALGHKVNGLAGQTITQTDNAGTASSLWKDISGVIGYGASGMGLHRANMIAVSEGQQIDLTTTLGTTTANAAFVADNSDNILQTIAKDGATTSASFNVPTGGSRLYVNYLSTYSCKLYGEVEMQGETLESTTEEYAATARQVNGGEVSHTLAASDSRWYDNSGSLGYQSSTGMSRYNSIAVEAGQLVKIIGAAFTQASWERAVFCDDNGNVISTASAHGTNLVFEVPTGATKMYTNSKNGDSTFRVLVIESFPDSLKKYLAISAGVGISYSFDDSMFNPHSISGTTGLPIASDTAIASGFFDILPDTSFIVSTQNSYRLGMIFYDENYQFLQNNEWYTSGTITAPNGAYFMRIKIVPPSGQSIRATLANAQPSISTDRSVEYVRAKAEGNEADLELPIYAPSPQRPADGSSDADFDAETLTPSELDAAFDALIVSVPQANKQDYDTPKYITKYSIVGRDATNAYDINAYVLCLRNRYAWKNADKLFAYKNGGTIVYIDSASPQVGDTIYSDSNRTDSGKTISSFDSANQRFTGSDSVVYTKSADDNVPAVVVYSKAPQKQTPANLAVYDSSDASVGTATAIDLTHISIGGKTYTRCADLDQDINSKGTIFLWGNEHGPQSDPAEPAIILYRFAKDLCVGCRNNPFLSYLKNNYKIILIPCANPYGLANHTRNNANDVNINRNYNTPGWASQADTDKGSYAGDQPETQFVMNTGVAVDADIAIDIHCLGYVTASNEGKTHYEGYIPSSAFLNRLVSAIGGYSLACSDYGGASPSTAARGTDWINYNGMAGGLLEMNAGPYATSGGDGKQHAPIYIEADYTLLLGSIRVWLAQMYPALDLSGLCIK